MPLPGIIGGIAGGIGLGKKIFGGIKKGVQAIKGKRKPPLATPPTVVSGEQAKRSLGRFAQGLQGLMARAKVPTPAALESTLQRFASGNAPPSTFGSFGASDVSATALDATMPTKEAANLAFPVLAVIVLLFFFLFKRR